MSNKKAKKATKNKAAVKKAKPPVNPKAQTAFKEEFEAAIKDADSVLLITTTKGLVEVRPVKNVNYAYQVKGILQGALDSYMVIPISKALQRQAQIQTNNLTNMVNTIKNLLGDSSEKPEEEPKKD